MKFHPVALALVPKVTPRLLAFPGFVSSSSALSPLHKGPFGGILSVGTSRVDPQVTQCCPIIVPVAFVFLAEPWWQSPVHAPHISSLALAELITSHRDQSRSSVVF